MFSTFSVHKELDRKCKSQVEKICQTTSSNDTLNCDGLIKITYIGDIPTHPFSSGKGNKIR